MEANSLTVVRPSAWQLLWRITRTYTVTTDALTMQWGIVRHRTQRIPRDKITNVDLNLNYVMPGMSGVTVNVGSGEQIRCRGLTRRSARVLAAALTGPWNDESRPTTG